jgi:hypothetical protein
VLNNPKVSHHIGRWQSIVKYRVKLLTYPGLEITV